jgi:hypothetical protein
MNRGFLDLDPSNDPEFFWQIISGPPVYQIKAIFSLYTMEYGCLWKSGRKEG